MSNNNNNNNALAVPSSDEGFAEDLTHATESSASNQSLLDSLSSSSKDTFDAINVVVRVRPTVVTGIPPDLSYRRSSRGGNHEDVDIFPAAGQMQIPDPQSGVIRSFTFDVIFEPEASQEMVFEHSRLKRFIDMSLEGFASTVFAYGQTGSGKTFTMTGNIFPDKKHKQDEDDDWNALCDVPGGNKSQANSSSSSTISSSSSASHISSGGRRGTVRGPKPEKKEEIVGLVQFTFAYLWEQIQMRSDVKYIVTASFLEIYNEHVYDLLNPTTKSLQVRWSKDRGFYAENLFKVECEDLNDLEGVLREGLKNRSVRSHEMNLTSSRSHSLLTINLSSEMKDPEDPNGYIKREGRICLVDLAGSEKTKRTGSKGETLVEANNINKSLLVLGNCIHQLSSTRSGHIPYRDSILTKLLADSLAGSGMTLMVACVSALPSDASETINTLRYASRAKNVKTRPIVRMDPRELSILSLKREVRLLRMENLFLRQQMNLGAGQVITGAADDREKAILQQYMRDNENLRLENNRLISERDRLIHDQEESDRALVKMEKAYDAALHSHPTAQNGLNNTHLMVETDKMAEEGVHSDEVNGSPLSAEKGAKDKEGIGYKIYSSTSSAPTKSTSRMKPTGIPVVRDTSSNRNKSSVKKQDSDGRRPSIIVGWDENNPLEIKGSNAISTNNRSGSKASPNNTSNNPSVHASKGRR